jgi:hypothetical protein
MEIQINSLITGTVGIIALMIAWTWVQNGWKKVFRDDITDEDVLAGRSTCGNCGCLTICKKNDKELTEHIK